MASTVAASSGGREGPAIGLFLFWGLLLTAAVWAAASLVPFGFLLAKARSLTAGGQISFFSHDYYRSMQLRLRVIGAANLAGSLLVFRFRRPLARSAAHTVADFIRLREGVLSAARSLPMTEAVA